MVTPLSIVLPTHNCLNYLKLFIKYYRQNTIGKEHELVIVCDYCTDGTQDWLKSMGLPFYDLTDPHPPSAEQAWKMYNYGFTKTTKPYVCFSNDDLIFCPKWDEYVQPYLSPDIVLGMTLVEPGTAGKPWRGIIEKNLGDNFLTFDYPAFLALAEQQPDTLVPHEGVDINTVWHRDRFDAYQNGWMDVGPTILDEAQPYYRATRAMCYHFSNRSRTFNGDRQLGSVQYDG